MITFSKLEKKGHLGNQLFQIASTIGIAKKYGRQYGFRPWKYRDYFINPLPEIKDFSFFHLAEKRYEYHNWDIKTGNFDIDGWLQTEKYFDIALTKHYLTFKNNVINSIKEKYSKAFKKKTILLSIRRGDFVNHPDYYQTPIKFYFGGLINHFSNLEDYNLIVLSDDIEYCKFHFGFLNNAFFGDGLNVIEQLCLGSLCNNFIIGNSTFSWWSAWLGEKVDSKVITPVKNFRGDKARELNDKDYFPERWTTFDHTNFKVQINAEIYIKKNRFLNTLTSDYFSHYFKVKGFSFIRKKEDLQINSADHVIIYNDNNICSPIAIYFLYLKSINATKIVLSFNKKVNINYSLSYHLFDENKDFGIYSSVFKSKTINHSNKKTLICYFDKNNDLENSIGTYYVGRFSKYIGYKFCIKKSLRKTTIFIKKMVKQALKKNK